MSKERKLMRVFPNSSSAKTWENGSEYTEPYVGYIQDTREVHWSKTSDVEKNTMVLSYAKAAGNWYNTEFFSPGCASARSATTEEALINSGYKNPSALVIGTGSTCFVECKWDTTSVSLVNEAFKGTTRINAITKMPYGLTSIPDSCFQGCTSLSTALSSIPSTVKTIGASAFKGASLAGGITLPSGLTTIGSEAFASTKLTTIKIPDKVSSIGSGAFQSCTAMTAFSGSGATFTSITDNLFSSCGKLATVQLPSGIKTIGNRVFEDCTALTSFNISQNITSIGDDAFNNTRIRDAVLPSGLTHLGTTAFGNNTSLTSLTITTGCKITAIPEECFMNTRLVTADLTNLTGVTSINADAFANVTSLTSVTLPAKVGTINEGAFDGCLSLKTINWGTGLTTIGDEAFKNNSAMTEVTIPNTVSLMGLSVFQNNTALTDITFPTNASFSAIPQSTCSGDYALSGVNIPDNVTSIGGAAFAGCSGLTKIGIPDSVTDIEANVFSGCTELYTVHIGSGITSIGAGAFAGCLKLAKFEVNAVPRDVSEVPSLADDALDLRLKTSDDFHILVPEGTKVSYDAAPNWKEFKAKIEEH